MKTLGNIIWFILIGLWAFLVYALMGLIFCITIIGIPIGKQLFKIAELYLTPFGKTVNTDFSKHPVLNILWIIFLGWEMAIGFLAMGIVFCITLIGIPFGKQCFKLMSLAFMPFGATCY